MSPTSLIASAPTTSVYRRNGWTERCSEATGDAVLGARDGRGGVWVVVDGINFFRLVLSSPGGKGMDPRRLSPDFGAGFFGGRRFGGLGRALGDAQVEQRPGQWIKAVKCRE